MKKFINSIIAIIVLAISMFLCADNLKASIEAYINNSSVNIRTGAGTNNSIIATVNTNTVIELVDKTLYSGSGCTNKWYKVIYKNKTGYVCSDYVSIKNTTFTGITVLDWTARVNSNNTTVRSGAGTSYSSKTTLSYGTNIRIDSTHAKGSGCDDVWYKINYYDNQSGYMCGTFVTKKSDISASDLEYEKKLKEKGFPESYWPYLTYLHNKYPNWEFNADINKLDFAASVSGEDNKNYMQTTISAYRKNSTPAEGSSWFYATTGVIGFYLDPRNFLNDNQIFMFEKLDYDNNLASVYPKAVKTIFGTGKLGDDKYTIPMVNAGKKHNISPLHIASRIRLEVGKDGSDSTNGKPFTFKGTTYPGGFYNFFNIGAFEETIDGVKYSAVTRGLAYAAKLIPRTGNVWDDIEVAITEGSAFLANGYINAGQNTLYYQKFNTYPGVKNPYTHQYMTNVQAPTIESESTKKSYESNKLLDVDFTFDIPVYSNMPAYTSLPQIGDTNNELSSITVNGTLVTGFDPDVIEYTHYVPTSSTTASVVATTVKSTSTISGAGTIELQSDETVVTIKVTSQNGTEKSYKITIIKTNDTTTVNDIVGKLDAKVESAVMYNLKNGTTVTTMINSVKKAGANSTVTIKDASGKVVSNSQILKTGYTITIATVNDKKTFTISVKGDVSGDGKITILDLLQVQNHITKSKKLNGAYLKAAQTSGNGTVTILELLQIQNHITGTKKF